MTTPDDFSRDRLRARVIGAYDPPGELDPHELVADYEAYTEYTARNPNAGSYAVASAIDAPRGRVRAWMERGAVPDAARGVFTADRNGWLAVDGNTHLALTRLVAGVFAGGSIIENTYNPAFSADRADFLADALREIGAGVETVERDHPDRGNEIRPARHRPVLGRVLAARGAPVGEKIDAEGLPEYLFADGHADAADAFCQTYLRLRGVNPESSDHVRILEQGRQSSYHDSLHALFDQRVPGPVSRVTNGVSIPGDSLSSARWLQEAAASL